MKLRFTQYLKMLILIIIVNAPLISFYINGINYDHSTNLDWMQEFMFGDLAWTLTLSIFDIVVVINIFRIFRKAPIFSMLSIFLAFYPLWWAWQTWSQYRLRIPQQAGADFCGQMSRFFLFGGVGEVILFLLLPLTGLYFYLRSRERRTTRPLGPA